MGLQLSSHLQQEVLRARVSLILDDDRIKDLLPDMPGNGQAEIIDFTRLFPEYPTQ
jgi:penicillin amidase